MVLMLTTNVVFSIDAVFCNCFKTTTYQFTGLSEDDCCTDHLSETDLHLNHDTCCETKVNKDECKTRKNILLSNKENFVQNQSLSQKQFVPFTPFILTQTLSFDVISQTSVQKWNSLSSPPILYKLSRPFLQIFTC